MKRSMVLMAGIASLLTLPIGALAQEPVHVPQASINYEEKPKVILPLVICWFDGKKNLYIQTESSDPTVAQQQGVNYVPQLANAIDAPNGAVDDIYVFTNSKQQDQYNVLPSEPHPVGPNNTDQSYTPLWQVSNVTWQDSAKQTTLKSEKAVRAAEAAGLVTIVKTRIVLNCPVIYTDTGGLLPKAVLRIGDRDQDDPSRNR